MSGAKPIRVLIVTHYAPPHHGGIEIVAYEQARRLRAAGHAVTWFSAAIPRVAPTLAGGVNLTRHPALNPFEDIGIPYPLLLPGAGRSLRALVRSADIVHAHGMLYQGTSMALRLARRFGKRSVLTCHVIDRAHAASANTDSPLDRARAMLLAGAETFAHSLIGARNLRAASAVVVLNDRVSAFVRSIVGDASRVHSIPNGVDTAAFFPANLEERRALRRRMALPEDRPLIAFVGRLVPRKGADLVARAAPHGSHVVIVGEGTLEARVAEGVGLTTWGAQPRERIAELLRAADIVALPSVGEGFPLVAQEAMASGTPVLLSSDPSYRAIVGDHCAVLVEPSLHAVHDALRELLADAERHARMRVTARALMLERFSWDLNIQAHLALYRSLSRSEAPRTLSLRHTVGVHA